MTLVVPNYYILLYWSTFVLRNSFHTKMFNNCNIGVYLILMSLPLGTFSSHQSFNDNKQSSSDYYSSSDEDSEDKEDNYISSDILGNISSYDMSSSTISYFLADTNVKSEGSDSQYLTSDSPLYINYEIKKKQTPRNKRGKKFKGKKSESVTYIDYEGLGHGDERTIECLNGYVPLHKTGKGDSQHSHSVVKSNRQQCGNGEWSSTQPVCVKDTITNEDNFEGMCWSYLCYYGH